MFKRVAALLLLIAFALQTFNKVFVVTSYFTNTKAFAKNCINKNKPNLHCNGKCQLKKKLQEENKKDDQNCNRCSFKDEVFISINSFVLTDFFVISNVKKYIDCSNHQIMDYSCDFFHPPSALVS